MTRDRGKRLLGTAVLIVAWAAILHPVGAQEGTPVTSGAVECPADERLTTEELRELGATPGPDSLDLETSFQDSATSRVGTPADAETTAAVTATIRQYFSCVDSGDWASANALYADDTLRYLVTDPTRSFMDVDPTTADYPFLRQHRGLGGVGHDRIDIYQIARRPDGRIGAAIAVEEELRRTNRGIRYIVLAWENGRWRLVSPLSSLAFPYGVNPATP